jgi:hypothetical protein
MSVSIEEWGRQNEEEEACRVDDPVVMRTPEMRVIKKRRKWFGRRHSDGEESAAESDSSEW